MKVMTLLSSELSSLFVLRSGAAHGADTAFESSVGDGAKEIFLPWRGFNGHTSALFETPGELHDRATEIAALLHPGWGRLSRGARLLMTRNVHQILGPSLDNPVEFVICWTPDGCESESTRTRATGGTGQAIALASRHNIPVFNLANGSAMGRISEAVK